MPQRKEIKWAQLRVGLMITASLVILAVGIFLISGQIGFLTRKYTLKAYFSGAKGLRQGARVQVAGIPAGNVARIRLSQYHDPNRAVEVEMRIARRYEDQIRADSEASEETAGLLGETFLDISRGSPDQPVVPDGGVIKSHEEADIRQIVQNANDVIANTRVLSAKLNDITNQITSGRGSIGKMIYDPQLYNRLNTTVATAEHIVTGVQNGQGTLGKLVVDTTVYDKTVATIDRLNRLMDQVQNGNGTLAKLINDPTVYNQARQLLEKGNTLANNINQGQGTLGKLVTDPQLYNRVNDTAAHLDGITGRMDRGEGSLGLLSTNSKLYNNLSQSAQSLSEFLTEFKKNPKRYLTLHLHIF